MFAQRLRELREAREMTQREIADLLGLTPKAIGFYEQGQREPAQEALLKLSDIFDVSVDYLLGKTDNKKSYDQEAAEYIEGLKNRLKSKGYDITGLTDKEIEELLIKGFKLDEIYKSK